MASRISPSPAPSEELEPTRWRSLPRDVAWTKTLWKSNHPGAKAFRAVALVGGLGIPFLEIAILEAFARFVIINPGITLANHIVRWIQPQGNDEDLFPPENENEENHDVLSVSAGSKADDERDSSYAFVPVHSDSESITGSENSQHARTKSAVSDEEQGKRELIERALEGADLDSDGVARLEQSTHSQDATRESAEILSNYGEEENSSQEVIQALEDANRDSDGVAHPQYSDSEDGAPEQKTQENVSYYVPDPLQKGWIYTMWQGKGPS